MAQERNGAATVISQEGNQVRLEHSGKQLTVSLKGFPPGFRLRPGDRVILVDETSGTVARPLVRAISSRLARESLRATNSFEVDGRQLQTQESTIFADQPKPTERASDQYVVWVVERGHGEVANQVIAVRPGR